MTGPFDDADRELIERGIRHDGFGVATSPVLRLLDVHDAATATLDRLREALALVNQNGDLIAFRGRVTVALARQPEAPVRPNTGGGKCGQMFTSADDYPRPYPPPCPECAWPMGDVHSGDCKLMCRPEAPKGQGDHGRVFPDDLICMMSEGEFVHVRTLQNDLAAANARIETLEEFQRVAEISANARIAEQAQEYEAALLRWDGLMRAANARADTNYDDWIAVSVQLGAANARADAAERTAKALEQQVADGLTVRADLRTERDQLAARVKELEQDKLRIMIDLDKSHEDAAWQERRAVNAESNQCTPKERKMLEAMADAANARADAAEGERCNAVLEWHEARDRADAAERALEEVRQMRDAAEAQYGAQIVGLRDERDQLAARVTELTTNYQTALDAWNAEISERQLQAYNRELAERTIAAMNKANLEYLKRGQAESFCTPEERAVLDACREMRLEEEDADDEPGEPVEVGEDCYIYTDDQHAIVRAELANRAAKAKRGGA